MKKAHVWQELISFVECPTCEEVTNLGDDLLDAGAIVVCDHCDEEIEVTEVFAR